MLYQIELIKLRQIEVRKTRSHNNTSSKLSRKLPLNSSYAIFPGINLFTCVAICQRSSSPDGIFCPALIQKTLSPGLQSDRLLGGRVDCHVRTGHIQSSCHHIHIYTLARITNRFHRQIIGTTSKLLKAFFRIKNSGSETRGEGAVVLT